MAFRFTQEQNKGFPTLPNRDNRIVKNKNQKQVFGYYSKMSPKSVDKMNTRSTVDDAVWDRIVIGLMEEYDEAWTILADK